MAYLSTHTLEEMDRSAGFASIKAFFSRTMHAMQVARMESVLSQMTPSQLDQIGITYADIPDYARQLLATK